MNWNALITLAEGTTNNTQQGGWQNWLMTGVMLVGVLVVGYFFIIRPQKKQEKEAAALRNSLQVGDEVTTIGGIIGKIVSVKDATTAPKCVCSRAQSARSMSRLRMRRTDRLF